jgi:hypothetical protein
MNTTTTTTSSSLADLHNLSTNFLGPRLISLFLQCLELGFIIDQSIEYWSNVLDMKAETETGVDRRKGLGLEARRKVQILVGFVTIAGL